MVEAAAGLTPWELTLGRCVWIISYTPASDEPRLLRQAWSYREAGWNVVVAGYEGASERPAGWHYLRLDSSWSRTPRAGRVALRGQRLLGRMLYRNFRSVSALAQWGARITCDGQPHWRRHCREIVQAARANPRLKPDLVIAHDPPTCAAAQALADWAEAPWMIDAHEYGRGQYAHDPAWMADRRWLAIALQDYYFRRANAVTTVCDGIARLLDAEEVMRRPATVIRSVPFGQPQPFRPCGDRIIVLYHGILSDDRGLEEAVRSLPMWRPEFSLLIRGGGEPSMTDRLRGIAAELGVSERLQIEPPVPFNRIVPEANRADIGYFVQGDFSPQKRFTLPNKFFEYVMAGLCLCVADLPEMAALVRQYGMGSLVRDTDPVTIASAINALTRPQIDAAKQAAILAARELTWEREQERLLALTEALLREARR
jgi:glycosyltransferase involved in cell wall biosynthesis